MKRKPRTEEQRAKARAAHLAYIELIKNAAKLLQKPYMEVSSIWTMLDDGERLGVTMGDPGALGVAKRLIEKQFPPMSRDDALGIMQWAVRKIRDRQLCEEAMERAMRLLEEDE